MRSRSLALAVAVVAVALAGCVDTPKGRNANLEAFAVQGDPYLGDPDAQVVVVSFESPLCSGCRHFHLNTLPSLKERYFTDEGPAVFYFKQFDTYGRTGHGQDERALQIAMECAARTSKEAFWSLSNVLYAEQFKVGRGNIQEVVRSDALQHGYEATPILDCYSSGEGEQDVIADLKVARDLSIRGTPRFFVFGPTGAATATNDLVGVIEAKLDDIARGA